MNDKQPKPVSAFRLWWLMHGWEYQYWTKKKNRPWWFGVFKVIRSDVHFACWHLNIFNGWTKKLQRMKELEERLKASEEHQEAIRRACAK